MADEITDFSAAVVMAVKQRNFVYSRRYGDTVLVRDGRVVLVRRRLQTGTDAYFVWDGRRTRRRYSLGALRYALRDYLQGVRWAIQNSGI